MVVVAGVLVVCGACGAPSRQDWAREADKVCERYRSRAKAMPDPGESLADIATYSEEVVKLVDEQRRALRDLDQPSSSAGPDELEAFLVQQRELAKAIGSAAAAGDVERVDDLIRQATAELGGRGEKVADDLGLKVCGRGG